MAAVQDIKESVKNSKLLGTLRKATAIELFFDLVFIICMRSLTPILTQGSETTVGPYECYVFMFGFLLMIQAWFSATMLMNRCGTGGKRDVRFLLITMFLLFLLTRVISINWEHYFTFNILWVLINVNLIVNWIIRYRQMDPEVAAANKRYIRRIVISHGAQAVLVLVSLFFGDFEAQVCCGIALLLGFASWPARHPLTDAGREHLVERCSLFVILAFGEALVGLSRLASDILLESSSISTTILESGIFFLLTAGLFLIHMTQVDRKLDFTKIGGGMRYMAITGLQVFCVMNFTAAFELEEAGKSLAFVSNDEHFALFAMIYMLSFFLYLPLNKPPVRKGRGWMVARVVMCVLPFALTYFLDRLLTRIDYDETGLGVAVLALAVALLSLLLFMLGSYIVWLIDCAMYKPKKEKKRNRRAKDDADSDVASLDASVSDATGFDAADSDAKG